MPPVRDRYLNDKILTATPTELIQMLLDRCVVEMTVAQERLAGSARSAAAPHLRKAQDIVSELRTALRLDAGDIAGNLDAIYAFAYRELVEAQLTGTARLDGAARAIAEIRDGWRDAFTPAASGSSLVADLAQADRTTTSTAFDSSLVADLAQANRTTTSTAFDSSLVADLAQANRTTAPTAEVRVDDSTPVAG